MRSVIVVMMRGYNWYRIRMIVIPIHCSPYDKPFIQSAQNSEPQEVGGFFAFLIFHN